jgi:hypothetical protein
VARGRSTTPPGPDPEPGDGAVANALARILEHDGVPPKHLVDELRSALAQVGRVGGLWLANTVIDLAHALPVRDADTLSDHHGGLAGDALADSLVQRASRATGTVGATGGVLATIEWAAPPTLLSLPALLITETLIVTAIELKLVAELHAVHGVDSGTTGGQRATAVVATWSRRTAAQRFGPGALSGAARRQLQMQLLRRFARMGVTIAPFLAGAVAGGLLCRRETQRMGNRVSKDLRKRAEKEAVLQSAAAGSAAGGPPGTIA